MQHYANLDMKRIIVKMIGWLHNVLYVILADDALFNLPQKQSGFVFFILRMSVIEGANEQIKDLPIQRHNYQD